MSLQIARVGTLDKASREPQDYSQYTRLPYITDPYSYTRRATRTVMVGDVGVGGDNPIRVQSMTTTDTLDTAGTVAETIRLVETGCEIVRITTPTAKDAENLKNIRAELERQGYHHVPLVADIHFNPNAAMEAAKWADKVRINPGNFADAKKFAILEYTYDEYQRELERIEAKFKPLLLRCKELGRSIRIGTNHGSLSDRIMNYYGDTPEGMVESAMEFALIAEKYDFKELIFSMKASNPKVMIQAYRLLAARLDALGMNYPFHLGVTEAGNGEDGRIKSAIGIGSLLEDGIGDTIRVSLTEDPEHEIPVALRLARRYTPVAAGLLAKAAITDATPVPVATEWPQVAADAPVLPDARQPYHFNKPETHLIQIGTAHVGGENVPQISADLAGFPAELAGPTRGAGRALPVFGAKLKGAPSRPDFFEAGANVTLPENRTARTEPLNVLLNFEAGYLEAANNQQPDGFAVNISTPFADYCELLTQALDHARSGDAALLVRASVPFENDRAEIEAAARHFFPAVDLALEAARLAVEKGFEKLVLALSARTVAYTLRSNRLLGTRLQEAGYTFPVQIIAPEIDPSAHLDEHFINAAIATGALLTDGIGSVLKIANHDRGNLRAAEAVQLGYNILQAAGARSSKAEFIACPSCGRTLFNLQETTERIKARTSHLVGVKIAVMGCIVNGLGELADADFGYMGGAPGKVNLFVGKECLEKGVPTEQAVDRLVDLIKSHGRWIEPEEEETEVN
jgi:(E)-4-hydroxy-3-methylbut-2-enyl-diphosphate synthase